MIYHGFHYEPKKSPVPNVADAPQALKLQQSRLFLGFGLTGLILALIAVLFIFVY